MKKENKTNTKKLSGFYIALCCCVLVIGIAGYFTQKTTENSSSVMNTQVVEETTAPVFQDNSIPVISTLPPVIEITPAPSDETSQASETDGGEITEVSEYAIDNPDVTDNAITVSAEPPVFIMPVNGEVLEPFSDIPRYNNSLADWRTHNGVDLAADKGCSVSAAAKGVVDRIYDNAMGTCVEISHSGGFVTRYMGLADAENIFEGREVEAGEVIGTTGDCKGENVTQPHLHFEMDKDKSAVNPTDYLPSDN